MCRNTWEVGEQTGFIHIGADSHHKFPSLGTVARIIGFFRWEVEEEVVWSRNTKLNLFLEFKVKL